MNDLCSLRAVAVVVLVVAVSVTVGVLAYAYGWARATRRHWKMLQRAGSKITRDF